MKTKKLLSILLALMMMLSVVPMYASAAAETLAVKNVSQWPTLSYKTDQEFLYYGQKVSDFLIINDDEVVLNAAGEQVAGHFEFNDPNEIPNGVSDKMRATIKFVPDDETAYTGFVRRNCPNVMFKTVTTTPVLVNGAPTATSVDSGSSLSSSVISGGQAMNPYNPEDTFALNAEWYWTDPNQIIYESGEYEATLYINVNYEVLTEMIYVEVNSTVKGTTISELPVIEDYEYSPGLTYGDIELVGGKAVEYGTDIEVPGTFSIINPDGIFRSVGTYNIPVVFTPDDTESYTASECTVTVNVTKGNYKFVNENGEEIVPEITLPYGTTFDQGGALGVALKNMIKDRALLTGTDVIGSLIFEAGDKNTVAPLGTNTYNVLVRPYNSDSSKYNATNLQFVLTIEPATVDIVVRTAIDNNVRTLTIAVKDPYAPRPQGTFALYIDGVLLKEGLKTGENAEWAPTVSKAYDMKVVYTPVENDPCVVEDYVRTSSVRLVRYLTRINTLGGSVENYFGEEIELLANVPDENFGGWKITDANGNEITLEDAVIEGKNITFTMPDYDITVEAIDKTESSGDGTTGGIDDIFGDLTEGDSDSPIVNIFNNIIAWFRNLIETIKNFFRGIGDRT